MQPQGQQAVQQQRPAGNRPPAERRTMVIGRGISVHGTIQDAERQLAGRGRVVLRASGTEPVIRVMVEGRDAVQVERLSRDLADIVKRAADEAA